MVAYKSNPFEWIANDYSQEKNIQIIEHQNSIGQAKIVGDLIENISIKPWRRAKSMSPLCLEKSFSASFIFASSKC
jgi:hypothetical protein